VFMFVANAWGFMVSIWLNMAAVKLQYSDRMSTSLRLSFVQLLDDNRKSFRGLERREDLNDIGSDKESGNAPIQTFANLRKMALEIATQKTEAPAPHEKVVIGCKSR
jgi:solute carrier family 50 protein (sugar transporter)